MKFAYDKKTNLKPYTAKLNSELKTIKKEITKGYETDYASLNLCTDTTTIALVKKIILEKKKLKPEKIVVVGIGGSNLGTIAIHEAINGKYYDNIYFADTVDSDKTKQILSMIEPILKKRKNVIINIVSKSGGTTETISLGEIFIQLLKKYKKDYYKYIVTTSDKDSKLDKLGRLQGFTTLNIPKLVGGRYSVLSPVGLFPLGMLGIKIEELLKGAKAARTACLQNFEKNPGMQSAATIYFHNKKGKNIHDTFLFDTSLESIGKWYRQLMGESIGKEKNKAGKIVNSGITPTVSVGSADLHSMAQLYLGGPNDKLTTFITVKPNNTLKVPMWKEFDSLVPDIQGKKLIELMIAIIIGVKLAYKKKKRSFTEIILDNKTEFEIAYLLQMKMFEIIYLASLLGINAFNQPAVETYKIETKRILSK